MGPAFKTTQNKTQAKTKQKMWGQIKSSFVMKTKQNKKHGPFI